MVNKIPTKNAAIRAERVGMSQTRPSRLERERSAFCHVRLTSFASGAWRRRQQHGSMCVQQQAHDQKSDALTVQLAPGRGEPVVQDMPVHLYITT